MKILGMGNALVDIITTLEDDTLLETFGLPKGSMTLVDHETSNFINIQTAGLKKQKASGGSAANTIHGLAHMGVKTGFVGMVGGDDLGKFFFKDMKSKKISPMLFKSIRETGRAVALISPDSERTFATYLGAAVELSTEDLDSNIFAGYDYLYLEGYLVQDHDLIEKAVRLAKMNGMKVCIDLASYNIVEEHRSFFLELIRNQVDIVFANNQEAEALTGAQPEQAVEILGGYADIAIVKTGAEGSLIFADGTLHKIGIRPSKSIDTTGAGDMYASGFLYGLVNGLSLETCGNIGAILSGRVIEVLGAKMDESTWENIRRQVRAIMENEQ
ncbi:MAG: adenosine kinase [Bacteroidales bacterium]|nr:adenosine kinase [Bacteroidales bacterium]MDT8432258.1 adenosine kinase [Bacteroidales bacterium]